MKSRRLAGCSLCISYWPFWSSVLIGVGPDADRHRKSLIRITLEGSCFGADLHPAELRDREPNTRVLQTATAEQTPDRGSSERPLAAPGIYLISRPAIRSDPRTATCATRASRSFGSSGWQLLAWIWFCSWDPLRFMRRHRPHHLGPARIKAPGRAGHQSGLHRFKSPQQRSDQARKPVNSEQDNCSLFGIVLTSNAQHGRRNATKSSQLSMTA